MRFQLVGTVVVLFILVWSGCKKDPLIKTGVQPEEENLQIIFSDTFTLQAYSYQLDSIRTDGVTYGTIGFVDDVIFGKSTASLVTQIKPSGTTVLFSNFSEVVVDSVVFSILPTFVYNNETTNPLTIVDPFSFDLYSLTEDLLLEDNYYSFDVFSTATSPMATSTYTTLSYNETTLNYQTIDFKLDSTIGYDLLEKVSNGIDNATFWSTYKGFVVSPNLSLHTSNLMFLIDLYNNKTKLKVYYKQSSTATIQEQYDFVIDNKCERINLFDNDYSNSVIEDEFNNSTSGNEKIFVQDMSGVGTSIQLPFLNKLYNNKRIVVSKAELVFPVNLDEVTYLSEHAELTLKAFGKDSSYVRTVDEAYGESHFDGTLTDGEYRFNITRDIQYVLDEQVKGNNVNFGYSLLPLSPAANVNGTIIYGTNPLAGAEKTKFVITYSEI